MTRDHIHSSGESLFEDVARYAELGDHRTGSVPDLKTSEWLADELRKSGFEAQLHEYEQPQFFLKSSSLKVGGTEVDAFPVWWPKTTGEIPIVAPLVALSQAKHPGALRGKVALAALPAIPQAAMTPGSVVPNTVAALAGAGAVAVVVIMDHPSGEVVGLNARHGISAWPIPVLGVGKKTAATLGVAAAAGAEADVLVEGQFEARGNAHIVTGRFDRGSRLIAVSTPKSGWFRCAGERGPGIALWLGLARRAAVTKSDISYQFVATSGHELNGEGIHYFLTQLAPKPDDVTSWLHLGAGIAVYDYQVTERGFEKQSSASKRRLLETTDEALLPPLARAFADFPELAPKLTNTSVAKVAGGELGIIADAGYRAWGIAGLAPLHHVPSDNPERSTGPELLEPIGQAVFTAVAALEKLRGNGSRSLNRPEH